MTLKGLWVWYTEHFGLTILHPQYIKKKLEYQALLQVKKYGKGKLVDVGCGRMPYKASINFWGMQYTGVDHPKISSLYTSDKKPDVLASADKLPFKNATYDTAIMLQVLEYIPDPSAVFGEIYRILKKGGYLILSVPFLYPIHDVPYDRARYTESALKTFAKDAGFHITHVSANGRFIETWILLLQVFLFKSLQQALKKKSLLLVIVIGIFAPLSVLLGNSMVYLYNTISYNRKSTNEFPLDYTLVLRKI